MPKVGNPREVVRYWTAQGLCYKEIARAAKVGVQSVGRCFREGIAGPKVSERLMAISPERGQTERRSE